MSIITQKQSSHYYLQTGEPAYDLDLRGARKENAVPSITTIAYVMSNYHLEAWKQEQLLLSAVTLPEMPGEPLDDRIKRILADSQEHRDKAANLGSEIHERIEAKVIGLPESELSDKAAEIWPPLDEWIDENLKPGGQVEIPMVHLTYGYGGRVDYTGALVDGTKICIDWKTTGTKEGRKVYPYSSWIMQMGATSMLVNHDGLYANVVISSTEPGRIELIIYDNEELYRGWKMFSLCLDLWRLSPNGGRKPFPYVRIA